MCTGLTFTHAAPRLPASYAADGLLTTTPSCPALIWAARNDSASSTEEVSSRCTRCSAGTSLSRAAARSWPGESMRSSPSRCSTSKKNGLITAPLACAVREDVSWNGRGRPSAPTARASPSSTNRSEGSALATATTSGRRAVMSSRLRVTTITSSPSRCTWTRMPSSLASTTTAPPSPPAFARAAPTSGADEASIGSTGRPTSSRNRASPSSPSPSAASAIATVEPASIAARRTTVTGTPPATASASWTTASSAPWRTSPVTRPRSHCCSSAVARPNNEATPVARVPAEPGPASADSDSNASWTSTTVSVGSSAGSGSDVNDRQPTPVRRCSNRPPR